MTAPRPSMPPLVTWVLIALAALLFFPGPARAGAGSLCVPPRPLAPTPEPPLLEAIPEPLHKPGADAGGLAYPPTPIVVLHVRVPAGIHAGQELEYRICVENRSAAAAHHVLVRNPLPANARFVRASPEPAVREPELLWRLGTLAGGARQEIVLVLSPTSGEEVKNCARVQFEHGECVTTKIARPSLHMHKNGPTQAVLSETLHYQITLTNAGNAELSNLLVTDLLPAGLEHASGKERLSWIVGTLSPGQTQTVEYQVVAKKIGRLCNKVISTAAGGMREEMESCVTVGERKLGLTMTGPLRHYINVPARYRLTVSNPGTLPLTQVVINNSLPAETTLVGASDAGQVMKNQVQWLIGTLAPAESRTVEIQLRALMPGRICNRAMAIAEHGLTEQAEACTDFTGAPALTLSVKHTVDPVPVGGETSYCITVRNPGTKPVTRVQIVATAPEQMTVLGAGGASDNHKEGQKIIYAPLTLPPGGEASYRVDVKALRSGDVRFKVELTADQLTAGPVLQEESTTIFATLPASRKLAR
jgi:uncharacterized repeat protein (TIGR01451 family)